MCPSSLVRQPKGAPKQDTLLSRRGHSEEPVEQILASLIATTLQAPACDLNIMPLESDLRRRIRLVGHSHRATAVKAQEGFHAVSQRDLPDDSKLVGPGDISGVVDQRRKRQPLDLMGQLLGSELSSHGRCSVEPGAKLATRKRGWEQGGERRGEEEGSRTMLQCVACNLY